MLLSVPLTADEGGEVRFVSVPPRMRLKKQKASRLDINLETQSLSVKYRDANESEATEEREKMVIVVISAWCNENAVRCGLFRHLVSEGEFI